MVNIYIISRHSGIVSRGVETYAQEIAKHLSKYHQVAILKSGFGVLSKKTGSIIISTGGRFESVSLRIITWLRGQKLIIPGQSGLGFDDKLNLLCFPDRFIALTKYQYDWAQNFNHFVKTEVIPNGVDLNIFKPSKSKPKVPTVGYVAALYPEKRQELLIRAVSQTNAKLILVGKGPDERHLTDLCRKFLPNRFKIINAPHDQMPEIFQQFTVFAYPTVPWESFGIAMLEAMACNIPVVATDDPIRREIIGDAGLFASPSNLAEKINLALINNWGSIPRHQAEKYSWEEIVKKYLELFKEL